MASHVTVISPSARSATIKTTPGTYLSDIRTEACQKFGLRPDDFILRYNNKALDLSRTIRLAGLVQGAKLELVQGSRSPTSVLVGLQLPGNTRLTEKFASNTTLWQILRHFESKKPGLNLTARSVPAAGQNATAGRLNYEMPILNVMGRERGSFIELQQTLSQLGIAKDVLLRLSFRNSGKPLEEAHEEISRYFRETDAPPQSPSAMGVPATSATNAMPTPSDSSLPPDTSKNIDAPTGEEAEAAPLDSAPPAVTDSKPSSGPSAALSAVIGPQERPITIFAPPTSSTPRASAAPHNPSDYDLSIDQAKKYQAHLQEASRNKKLLSDAELAEQDRLKTEKLNAVKDVRIRIRLPDQSQVEVDMDRDQTAADVYSFVRDMLEHGKEEFILRYSGQKGLMVPLKDGPQKLIADLGFQGRMLVTFVWGDHVGIDKKRTPTLKKEWRDKAQNMKIETPVTEPNSSSKVPGSSSSKILGKPKMSDADKEFKLKNLLGKGLFGKR